MIPAQQMAIQLIGPDQLRLTRDKPVPTPGATQILGRIECVGLCFSDMKLLHQFSQHPRKTPVLAHLADDVLRDIPSYVPAGAPTVPGHEVVLRVLAIGARVRSVVVGGRYLVQADFRDLKTAGSNGAFGYNFEGGLQQYALLDERVTVAADGQSYLLPVPEDRSASQLALVEPWACVEDAFRTRERSRLTAGGTVLLVGDGDLGGLDIPADARRICLRCSRPPAGFVPTEAARLTAESVNDLLYAGSDAAELEALFPSLAKNGLIAIATGGGRFGRLMNVPVGRVHYGNIRVAAATSTRFVDAVARIPASGELRPGDHVNVVGAGGPMGVMAMVRAIASSRAGALVDGGVRNPERAVALAERVEPFARARGVEVRLFNPESDTPRGPVDYCFLMAPVPALVQQAIIDAAPGGIINVFAGIHADVPCAIDLDLVCAKGLYFIGTSGSTMDDMRVVLGKVVDGALDTNLSVGAVAGMSGAIEGLNAVRDRTIAGKIIVYPQLGDFPLMEIGDLVASYPSIRPLLRNGGWTGEAERELLRLKSTG